MLPLHHAVVPLSRLDCFRDKPPHDLTRAFCRAPDQNKKGLLGDRPRRPVSR